MGVTHDFECAAHGVFESRAKRPKCPKGCSAAFVSKVFLQAPNFGSAGVRTSDKLVREMAEAQGLSDISTSPSRPGGSVADRLRKKNTGMKGPQGRDYPAYAAAVSVPYAEGMKGMTMPGNAMKDTGYGHDYNPAEWKKDEKTGKVAHVQPQGAIIPKPTGSTGTSVARVKGD